MAKPKFTSLAATARHPSASPLSSSNRANRSPRSRLRNSSFALALLATASATPSSAYHDPPETSLPFLYPPFILQPTHILAKRSPTPSTSDASTSTTPPPQPPPSDCPQDRSKLPDKYTMADDGLWHKTDWSLYGSTYCLVPCSSPCPPVDKGVSNLEGNPTHYDPLLGDFDISSLPTGWSTIAMSTTSRHGTFVVIGLSVALAVIILALMIVCVFWRRKLVPKRDPEKRRRRSSKDGDDDSYRSVREAKAAQKKWFRAACRWRDNVRFSARRRRTNRALASATSYMIPAQEGGQEAGTDTESSLPHSRSSSPTLTHRSVTPTHPHVNTSSRASMRSSNSHMQMTRAASASQAPPIDSPPSSPTQPPAYERRSSSHPPHASDCVPSSTSKAPISLPTQDDDDGSHPTSLSGHVATDDKAVLSLRAALASAPPGFDLNLPQSASVPSTENEDMFEPLPESLLSSPSRDSSNYEPQPPYSPPASLLPPPPSKGKQKFDYSHDLDICVSYDVATVEPQLVPSAPPFEESEVVPSAPPLDFDVDVPSAPPMDIEDCPDTTICDLESGALSR